ncbi:MAG: hypothetical protein GY821_17345 [Gammaproteobacteria bacterium]|nr:hypothetical protein [Gammaproteobacteria bacterium]
MRELSKEIKLGKIKDKAIQYAEKQAKEQENILVSHIVRYLKTNNVKRSQIDSHIKNNFTDVMLGTYRCYEDVSKYRTAAGVLIKNIEYALGNKNILNQVKNSYPPESSNITIMKILTKNNVAIDKPNNASEKTTIKLSYQDQAFIKNYYYNRYSSSHDTSSASNSENSCLLI